MRPVAALPHQQRPLSEADPRRPDLVECLIQRRKRRPLRLIEHWVRNGHTPERVARMSTQHHTGPRVCDISIDAAAHSRFSKSISVLATSNQVASNTDRT